MRTYWRTTRSLLLLHQPIHTMQVRLALCPRAMLASSDDTKSRTLRGHEIDEIDEGVGGDTTQTRRTQIQRTGDAQI